MPEQTQQSREPLMCLVNAYAQKTLLICWRYLHQGRASSPSVGARALPASQQISNLCTWEVFRAALDLKIRTESLTGEFKLTANGRRNFCDVGQFLVVDRTLHGAVEGSEAGETEMARTTGDEMHDLA